MTLSPSPMHVVYIYFCTLIITMTVKVSVCLLLEKIMLGLPSSSSNINHDDLNFDVGGCNPPIITHTAATPMATPQGSPNEMTGGGRDPRNTLSVEHTFPANLHSSTDSLEKAPVSNFCVSLQKVFYQFQRYTGNVRLTSSEVG